ncbi:MAG: efflux RND transporter permease subunit [Gammaproteobacteria bacterium]|uniref:efflux RND transporter permease subunit n=1 Tax=Rhodoferax sp. TaxID=50421 RepID=UPI001798F65A|nr:efflux RND transporter permease subunit [Rhodoferax sp.]MBU3898575.1 efflux RND transporter permease subunit [Gammaproteobacteria bacterium]MBA3059811.1 efflux RND transporter permease subunit [Rhodoferax sp.]MBU3997902.1 efflux RND transporter permease subunit [Gammaproteobacteria bacterium]MBU4079350.1 efflux RND transporter permease subunit [Gammaproteobacteria bacterium]MBU4113139.1 efflux RND transporter permease subunit [Gammaproteobacteria bacterium]
MNFSSLSIKHPVPAIMLFVLLSLAGILSFRASVVQDFPDIELPIVIVSAALAGAAPAQLETEVARKIEDSVATLQGVKNIYTKVLDGSAQVTVEFVLEKPIAEAVNDVRDAVARVRADLPADVRDPSVTKASTAGRVVLTFTAEAAASLGGGASASAPDLQALSWFVDNTVARRLLNVPGVGAVKRVGGVDREVRVELDADKMAALQVSAIDVSRRLKLVQQEAPGGRGDVSGAEQSVRTLATVTTAAELALLDLPLADGRHLRLDQVASVRDTFSEPRSLATQNGRTVVGFEVFRTKGASEVTVAQGVREAVTELQRNHGNLALTEVIDNAQPVAENFRGSMELLLEGALLAILVVWWFLRDWRATLVAAAALPLSIIPTFLGLYYFGYTLNTVTLLALALVVGVLVDDAIVEIENIERHLRMGKPPYQAAMEAADEIGMAVIATTFALVAVFLPTAFMGGIPGLFFKQFGWTAVLAILASLMVARLLTPMMAAYLLQPHKNAAQADPRAAYPEAPDSWVMARYLATMRWCLRHRALTLTGAALFFVGSIALVPLLPTGFVPAADRAQTQINIELAPGSTLAETSAVAEQARLAAMRSPEVTGVFSSIGGGSSGDAFAPGAAAEARRAVLTISTTHRNARAASMPDIEAQLRLSMGDIAGARFNVGPPDTGVKMQLVLKSDDAQLLLASAQQVERELRGLSGIGNVSSSAALVRPEIIVRPDFARAADLGVTAASIGETVRVATAGDYATSLAQLNLSERQVPIRVKLPDNVRADLEALARLSVPGKNGPVLLSNVASITVASGPAQIDRLNRSRNVTLDVELGRRQLGELNAEARALPSLKNLPAGVSIAELGDAQEMQALFASFGIAMLIGVLCIYGVLVLLFHDFMQPVTILAALPLSMGGAFVALLLTGRALSMPSMIGLIMLMGIVTKNSILLVDYAILARERGLPRFDALVDACHKRSRPIVMTTIAMGAGMLPLALGWGADPSFRSPMAIAVIGGLMTSTLLSLLVVPAVFTYIDDLAQWLKRLPARMRRQAPAAAGA